MRRVHQPWMDLAACPDRSDLPWTLDRDQVRPSQTIEMKLVCRGCLAFYECRDYVDCEAVTGGFWAGEHRELPPESMDGAA